jgi:hypothetical protein
LWSTKNASLDRWSGLNRMSMESIGCGRVNCV